LAKKYKGELAMSELARLFDLDPEAIRCPFPIYDHLREQAPVQYLEDLGVFVVMGYKEAVAALQDYNTFSSEDTTGRTASRLRLKNSNQNLELSQETSVKINNYLLTADEPEHARRRALVDRAFLPPQIRERESAIREICNALIADFGEGPVDFSAAFAVPLPMTVIANEIGVLLADLPTFKRWSDAIAAGVGRQLSQEDVVRTLKIFDEFEEYMTRMLEQRSTEPKDDVLTDVARAQAAGEITHIQAVAFLMELLVAGNETTTNHLNNTLLLLLNHPGSWEELRANRALVKKLIEESLRIEAPIQGFYRTAVKTTELGGVTIPAGAMLYISYQAANRDPHQFPEAAAMEIGRKNATRHITFGRGPHTCLGAPLARTEGVIAFETLLEHFSAVRFAAPGEKLEYHHSFINRGPLKLNVIFTPA
jgi:cytochrome P450